MGNSFKAVLEAFITRWR